MPGTLTGLGSGEERFVRSLGQQVLGQIQLMKDVTRGSAGLNLQVTDLAGTGHDNG